MEIFDKWYSILKSLDNVQWRNFLSLLGFALAMNCLYWLAFYLTFIFV